MMPATAESKTQPFPVQPFIGQQYFSAAGTGVLASAPPSKPVYPLELRVLIGSKMTGCLIGRGGAMITRMRAETGSFIRVEDPIPGAQKRIMQVRGTTEQVVNALCMISDKLVERRTDGASAPLDRPSASASSAATPATSSTASSPGPVSDASTSAPPTPAPTTAATSSGPAAVSVGEGKQSQQPRAALASPTPQFARVNGTAGGNNGESAGSSPGPATPDRHSPQSPVSDAGSAGSGSASGLHVITLLIPNEQIGSIIGKGGAKIVVTRESSGAKIRVSDKPLDESTEKSVTVQGNQAAVQKALSIICAQVEAAQEGLSNKAARVPYQPRPQAYLPLESQSASGARFSSRPSPAQLQITLPLPFELAGGIIGRGGTVARYIREQSGVTLKIADRQTGSERPLILHVLASYEESRPGTTTALQTLVANAFNKIVTLSSPAALPSAPAAAPHSAPYGYQHAHAQHPHAAHAHPHAQRMERMPHTLASRAPAFVPASQQQQMQQQHQQQQMTMATMASYSASYAPHMSAHAHPHAHPHAHAHAQYAAAGGAYSLPYASGPAAPHAHAQYPAAAGYRAS